MAIEKANAYSALIGALVGAVVSLATAAFFLGGQWERWVEIRDAHKDGMVINGEPIEVPDVSGFASKEELPDLSGFTTTAELTSALRDLGAGKTVHPSGGAVTSSLCSEGYVMVGVKYTVASGDNAGALYHGLHPVCRALVR